VPCKDLIARGKLDTITAESEGSVKANHKEYGYCVDDENKEYELGADDSIDLFSLVLYPCALTDGSCKSPSCRAWKVCFINFFPTSCNELWRLQVTNILRYRN